MAGKDGHRTGRFCANLHFAFKLLKNPEVGQKGGNALIILFRQAGLGDSFCIAASGGRTRRIALLRAEKRKLPSMAATCFSLNACSSDRYPQFKSWSLFGQLSG
jgi:hypothetical protein